jgi:hypothetical protein
MSNESENERIDLAQLEELIESIVICEEEYIKGSDNLLEDCQTLKDRMQIILAELKRCYEKIDWLQKTADLAADYIGEIHHSNWDNFTERMYEAGLWERPSEE